MSDVVISRLLKLLDGLVIGHRDGLSGARAGGDDEQDGQSGVR